MAQKVLERFDMATAKSVAEPMPHNSKLSVSQSTQTDHAKEYMIKVLYASSVGSLMYLMVCTMLDLAYSVSMVSRFMTNPVRNIGWL